MSHNVAVLWLWISTIIFNIQFAKGEENRSTMNRPRLHSKPNILIFFVDDLEFTTDWNHSSPAGTDLDGTTIEYFDIKTPNIQSVVDEGIVFPRTYTGVILRVYLNL